MQSLCEVMENLLAVVEKKILTNVLLCWECSMMVMASRTRRDSLGKMWAVLCCERMSSMHKTIQW